ncbi:MAG: aminopeptidase [Actinomycetota bacterium]
MDAEELARRYADLAVRVGVNIQPDQVLAIDALIEHAPFARLLADAAYRAGARYVDVNYVDQHVRHAMVELAEEDMLTWTPPHLLERSKELADRRGGYIRVLGDPEPNLFEDLPADRVGKARMLAMAELSLRLVNDRAVSWAIVAYPNEGWARSLFGEPDVDRLWDAVARATRLSEDDPVAAWWAHVKELAARADSLNDLALDSLHYEGPGTDLTVGLHPRGRWAAANFETSWGQPHVPNLPTEEVFTSPDFRRAEGTIRSTRPLQLPGAGVTVEGLSVTFEAGKITEVEATAHADVIREQLATDDRAPYLGEVALVDRASAVGQTGMTFGNTLFDENATAHIAYGTGFSFARDVGDEELSNDELDELGVNRSKVHTDFMVGGPDVEITGITIEGDRIPIILDDTWQL